MVQSRFKKRFIAGAVCPECKQLDTIVMYPDTKTVSCTRCDYVEVMEEELTQTDRQQLESSASTTSVIRFIDPN